MSYKLSNLILADQMSLSDMKERRMSALLRLLERYTKQMNPAGDGLSVRAFKCLLDAITALDQWRTAPLAVIDNQYSCFQAIVGGVVTLPITRSVVFYGVSVEDWPLPVNALRFRLTGAAGGIVQEFDLEPLADTLNPIGYFSEPVCFDGNVPFGVYVNCRIATGVFARVKLMSVVVEKLGMYVSDYY